MALAPVKINCLQEMFSCSKPIIAMVHVPPLPGAPRFDAKAGVGAVYDFSLAEAVDLAEAGVHGLIIENGGDVPFLKPDEVGHETVTALAVIADRVRRETGLVVGINCLANAASQSIAAAQASGGEFVRANQWANAYVANEGIVEGAAGRVLRYRSQIGASHVKVFADVHVKHGSHAITADRDVGAQTQDAEFFDADVLIVSGEHISDEPSKAEIEAVREATTLPVILGSGVTRTNAGRLLPLSDGAIVGSDLKEDGVWWNRVSINRTRALVEAAAEAS